MVALDVSIKDVKKPPVFRFPERCANCGKPKARDTKLSMSTGAQKRGQMVQLELNAPLCADCAKKEDRITNVTLVPFTVVGLIVFALAFIPAWLISPEGTTPQTYGFSFVMGAFLAMVAGIVVGTLAEFLLKLVLAPAYGKSLLRRPLTILSFFSNSEDVLGLSARFNIEKKLLRLVFENDEVAREFSQLNPQEQS
jgi:hypothetical protein